MRKQPRGKCARRGARRLNTERLEGRMLLAADVPMVPGLEGPTMIAEDPAGGPNEPVMLLAGTDSGSVDKDRGDQHPRPPLEPQSIDGTGNNVDLPLWGSAGVELIRVTSVEYSDGISEPAGADRASPREISNLVAAQSESEPNERGLSDIVWQWGQFLDHDIDLSLTLSDVGEPIESLPIEVPTGDPYFDPFATGTQTIDLTRSDYADDSGDSIDNPREQLNAITAFIDGSNVYGSDDERAEALRTHVGGRLKVSDGNLLPFNHDGLENAGGPSDMLFLAGDVRANEQIGLTAMHTLWVREHNRIADRIAERDPNLNDEQIYQRARAFVIAEMQAITYNEFLPALLGRDAISRYEGYDPTVNPNIANVFSTAAYRFGHSMLSPELLRLDNDGEVIDDGNIALRDAFFSPDELVDNGIDSLLKGLASQRAQEIDSQLVDDVRNFLFGPPGSGGFDLASLNIQRGRDHGLADYNQTRVDFGLSPVTSFADITSDLELQAALSDAYGGDVNNIDVWVGALAEDHVRGAGVGELTRAVLADQFTRLRDGDRYWYQNRFSGRDLDRIEDTTLADVIRRNTVITNLQRNVFFVADAQPRHHHHDHHRHRDRHEPRPLAGEPLAGAPVTRSEAPEPGDSTEIAGSQINDPALVTPTPEEGSEDRHRCSDREPRDEMADPLFAETADEFFARLGS